MRPKAGLCRGGAGRQQPQGWSRPGAGGTGWPGCPEGGHNTAFWPPWSRPFVFSLCFPTARAPQPSRLPLIVCRVIKGQMSSRSLTAVTSQRHCGGGGWLRGGPGRVTGLTPGCAEHFSEGRLTPRTLSAALGGKHHHPLFYRG